MKVTYLLGAGASANAVPMAANLREVIKASALNLIKIVERGNFEFDNMSKEMNRINELYKFLFNENTNNKVYVKNIANNLLKIVDESKTYDTLDEYAKKLYLNSTNNPDNKKIYSNLKIYLSVFFILYQDHLQIVNYVFQNLQTDLEDLEKLKLDKRYIQLFNRIFKKEPVFSDYIKIFSWNYDFQFQDAYIKFTEQLKSESSLYHKIAEAITGLIYLPNSSISDNIDYTKTNLLQINGHANLIYNSKDVANENLNKRNSNFLFIENLFRKIMKFTNLNDNIEVINFAFEYDSLFDVIENKEFTQKFGKEYIKDEIIDSFKKHLDETTHLIIIGYSFPDFNYDIDKEFFNHLNFRNLKEIVIQNPEDLKDKLFDNYIIRDDDLTDFRERTQIMHNIKLIKDVKSFYIPNGFKADIYNSVVNGKK